MYTFKTIFILIFLVRNTTCSCSHSNLLEQLNTGMAVDCEKNTYEEMETCKIICTENNKIIKLDNIDSNAMTVYCKYDRWSYHYIFWFYYEIHPYLAEFDCIDVKSENFCSFEHFDYNALSVEDHYKGVTEHFNVKVFCKEDNDLVVNVNCINNQLYTQNHEKFDETFYSMKCIFCDKSSLEKTLNVYSGINSDCTKSKYRYGESCSIYCTDENSTFQTLRPATSLEVVCESFWKLKVSETSLEMLAEEMLIGYQCKEIQSDDIFCPLEVIDEQITDRNKYLVGLGEDQKVLIRCLSVKKSPLEIYCDRNGALHELKEKIDITTFGLYEYCEVGCKRADLIKETDEGITLRCTEDFYLTGQSCDAFCAHTDQLFNIATPTTKVELLCSESESWHLSIKEGNVSVTEKDKFMCRDKKSDEFYCQIDHLRSIIDFDEEYKGLASYQEIDYYCLNKTALNNEQKHFYCPPTIKLDFYSAIYNICYKFCDISKLDGYLIDLGDEPQSIPFFNAVTLKCNHKGKGVPKKLSSFFRKTSVICYLDTSFYDVSLQEIVSRQYLIDFCDATCDTEGIVSLFPHFKPLQNLLNANETLKILCTNIDGDPFSDATDAPLDMHVYCARDKLFYQLENNVLLTQKSFYDYCKVKCHKSTFESHLDDSVLTDCKTDIAKTYNEECSFYCKEEGKTLFSGMKYDMSGGKLVCLTTWKIETADGALVQLEEFTDQVQCVDSKKCSLISLDKRFFEVENDQMILLENQSIKVTCVRDGNVHFDIICSKDTSLHFVNSGEEATKLKMFKKCRDGCTEERLNDINPRGYRFYRKDCIEKDVLSEMEQCFDDQCIPQKVRVYPHPTVTPKYETPCVLHSKNAEFGFVMKTFILCKEDNLHILDDEGTYKLVSNPIVFDGYV